MTTRIKLKERVQWRDFIVAFFLFLAPMVALIVYGSLLPHKVNTPIAIVVITLAIVLGIFSVALRNRKRVLVIDGDRWVLEREPGGKILMEFDLTRPYYFAVALRQGIAGKYSKTLHRWAQVFLAQKGHMLRLETHYLEYVLLHGTTDQEWCHQIGPFQNPVLQEASNKRYTFDETRHLRAIGSPGLTAHGLPQYYQAVSDNENLLESILAAFDPDVGPNEMLTQMSLIHQNSQISFTEFDRDFTALAGRV